MRSFISIYLGIWGISVAFFWMFGKQDGLGYGILFLYLILPAAALLLSFFIGKRDCPGKWKWIFPLVFGVMYMFAEYTTFGAANMIAFEKLNLPRFGMIPACAAISLLGMGAGAGARRWKGTCIRAMLYSAPGALGLLLYSVLGLTGGFGAINPWVWFWIAVLFVSAFLLTRHRWYGCAGGLLVGLALIGMSMRETGQILKIERPLGIVLLLYYLICGVLAYRSRKM